MTTQKLSTLAAATAPAKSGRPPRHELNFVEFLQTFRRGELLAEGDQKLSELIESLRQHQGSGSLVLKLAFKVNKAGQIEITPDVTVKKPTRALGTGIYFASDEGRLTRRDPAQMDIEDEIERRRATED